MSRFTRKGTVSKGSGPIHLDSYALKGVPIRYSVPIFLPELIHLPPSWKQPVLPSQQSFYYDYHVEKKVLEQAKHRAISIAAEASLQMKEIQRLRDANQLVESRDPDSDDSVENSPPVEPPQPKPRPPIMPGNDILTPIPVTIPASNASGSQSGSSSDETAQTGQTSSGDSEGKSKVSNKDGDSVVPLGEMSIREFEGNINNDPFEITSLQAINDMEILQTVLQPIPPPIMTSASAATTNTSAAGPPQAPPTSVPATGHTPGSTHQASTSSPTLAHSNGSSSNLQLMTQQAPVLSSPANVTTPPASSAALPPGPSLPVQIPQRAGSAPLVGVASGSSPSNPFLAGGGAFAASTTVAAVSNPISRQFQQQQQSPVPPISIGAPPTSTAAPPISTNPFSAVSPPAISATPSFARPPSSVANVGKLIDIGQQPMPTSTPTTIIPPVATGGSPGIPPRSNPPIPRPRTAPAAAHSSPAPSSQTTVAAPLPVQRLPVAPALPHSRPGLGVPVLPPIPNSAPPLASSSGSAVPPSLPPPPYKVRPSPPRQHREAAAPPPYTPSAEGQRSGGQSSPQQPARTAAGAAIPPPVTPRTYKLPDPSASLSVDQKSEVSSIAGMGFPSPRVARAMLRCKDDKTKVFDFLFLVGRLEEQGHNGDSAETALLACNEKPEKAVEYLSKVEVYRGMGFAEQRIHEAYGKSKGDWDKVLDLLVQGR